MCFENEADFAAIALTSWHTLQLSFEEKNNTYFKWIEAIHTPDIFYFYNRSPYKSRHTCSFQKDKSSETIVALCHLIIFFLYLSFCA